MIIDDLNHLEIATQDNQVQGGYYYSYSENYNAGGSSYASGLFPQSGSVAVVIPGGGAGAISFASAVLGTASSSANAGYSQYNYSGYYW